MEERFEELLALALKNKGIDIHFNIIDDQVSIVIRGINGKFDVPSERRDIHLFNYLQYQAHLDITCLNKPQSGAFNYYYDGQFYDFRFAVLTTPRLRNGVLRILNCHNGLSLDELTYQDDVHDTFKQWLTMRSGLVIFTGLTGSGKTTTLYSLLKLARNKTVYSLEDPIEVVQENIVQLEINEKIGFSYDEGIKQILRHNPDIIMIGEIRDEKTAKMTVRAALTGCLVMTSLHAKSTVAAINRLLELGVNKSDLAESVAGIVNQQLYKKYQQDNYTCLYDILHQEELHDYLIDGHPLKTGMDELVKKGLDEHRIEVAV